MKEVCEKENLTVEEVFRFVIFVLMIGLQCDACLSFTTNQLSFKNIFMDSCIAQVASTFLRIHLIFHTLVVLL